MYILKNTSFQVLRSLLNGNEKLRRKVSPLLFSILLAASMVQTSAGICTATDLEKFVSGEKVGGKLKPKELARQACHVSHT